MHTRAPRASIEGSDAQMIWPEGTNPFHTHEYLVCRTLHVSISIYSREHIYSFECIEFICILYSNNVTVDVPTFVSIRICVSALKDEARSNFL